MPHPLKPQIKALAAFSAGIAKAEERGLNAAAKKLPLVGNPIAVARDTASQALRIPAFAGMTGQKSGMTG